MFQKLKLCTQCKYELFRLQMKFPGTKKKNLPWVIHLATSSSGFPVCTQIPPVQRSIITWTPPPYPAGAQNSRRTQRLSNVLVKFRMSVQEQENGQKPNSLTNCSLSIIINIFLIKSVATANPVVHKSCRLSPPLVRKG